MRTAAEILKAKATYEFKMKRYPEALEIYQRIIDGATEPEMVRICTANCAACHLLLRKLRSRA
jgi:hypothetical protein